MSTTEEKALQTTRFTHTEKEILYALFQQHEDIIDIKYRKSSRPKRKGISVKECWVKIAEEYNRNPNIVTPRNPKQVQKFWLNVRTRKKYPCSSNINTSNEQPIKAEDIDGTIHTDHHYVAKEESECYEDVTELHSPVVDDLEEEVVNGSHLSIDQISTEKLSLTDLLEFKNSRPRQQREEEEDAVVVHGQKTVSAKASSSVHSIRQHQQQQQQRPPQHVQHRRASSACRTNETHHHPTDPCCTNSYHHSTDAMEDRINYFKLKEAELKYKEQEVRLQQKKLELLKARTELRNMREIHLLQVEEMKIKLRILNEEEKNIKNIEDEK